METSVASSAGLAVNVTLLYLLVADVTWSRAGCAARNGIDTQQQCADSLDVVVLVVAFLLRPL